MKSNKLIIGIMSVQTVMVLVLTYVVFNLEARTGQLAYEIAAARISSQSSSNAVQTHNVHSAVGLNENDTRRIIREEMNVLAERLVSDGLNLQTSEQPKPAISRNEIVGIHAEAATQIRSMTSFGVAKPQDIAKFESTIVSLPAKEREAAMREFMKAINQGNIQAKF